MNPTLWSRRAVVRGGAGLLALPVATVCRTAQAQSQARAERLIITNSYIADIAVALGGAPLVVAVEKGFFAKHGMPDVKVMKQTSWAVTRDNLELGGSRGGIDGAHILSPMPMLLTAGTITKTRVASRSLQ
jgi:nitrate/nitrite transport system substrate-binding protein